MKKCSKCNLIKDKESFSKEKLSKDGLQNWCKKCCSEYHGEYRKKNKERIKRNYRKWLEKNPNHRKEYRLKNKEKIKQDWKQWYNKNREKRVNYLHKWYAQNSDYFKQRFLNNKEHIKKIQTEYRKTEGFRNYRRKIEAKRRRGLNWIRLFDNPFPEEIDVDYHHINNILVLPMAKITHQHTQGKQHKEHNSFWIEQIYGLDIEKLFEIEVIDSISMGVLS